uniref:Uncharacterized protein n=1 Tax=Arundo donax TaxID=35708 RepID=A0A0A9E3D0_ARUDO
MNIHIIFLSAWINVLFVIILFFIF